MMYPKVGSRWRGEYGDMEVVGVRSSEVLLRYLTLTAKGEELYRRNQREAYNKVFRDPIDRFWDVWGDRQIQ